VLDHRAELGFVEVISENFMIDGGRPLWVLERVRDHLPVALHGVSMSIGSADGLDRAYLKRLRQLVDRVEPLFVSDHLCWTGVHGFNSHDLLPLPYSAEALDVTVSAVSQAQEALGRAMLIENPSSYISFAGDEMDEAEFLAALSHRSGCGILLDVNNVFVSAANHGWDALDYLRRLPADRIGQIHLAGHRQGQHMLIDTHDAPVCDGVWALYRHAITLFGPVPTMIERDGNIPPLAELLGELAKAKSLATTARSVAA
jgi:uncharacterized protein